MIQRFVYPPPSSPISVFTITTNETVSWIEIVSHKLNVKVATQKIALFSVTSHEITQIILIFLSQTNITN